MNPADPAPPPSSPPPGRGRGFAAVSIILALIAGLAAAEFAFALRDDFAFPHLNLYVADEALGVRLLPGGAQGFSLGKNPRSDIRINAAGYRGADWGPHTADEVLVVGDSQVFGLGVDVEETFSAQLEARVGRKVLNGGVPTYGPEEYTTVVAEVLPTRPVTDVIYVINMVNDLFENERPNRDRHRVLDGWAVRTETMPDIVPFPGRTALFRQSHMLYAWRRLTAPPTGALRTASEGSAQDLLGRMPERVAAKERRNANAERAQAAAAKAQAVVDAEHQTVQRAEAEYIDLPADIYDQIADLPGAGSGASGSVVATSFAGAGDIVQDRYAEASRPVLVTADDIRRAAAVRRTLVARWKRGNEKQRRLARDVLRTEQARRETRAEWARPFDERPIDTPLMAHLQKVHALAQAHGARLSVVVLPIDVQVHPVEWAKYDAAPQDLSETEIFISEIVESSQRLGIRAVSLLAPLRKAEPGAFLHGDIHLTPQGHGAVAATLQHLLTAVPEPVPAPLTWPLPEGHTVVPTSDEWLQEREIIVTGTSAAHCGTWQIDEWFRITCTPREPAPPYADALVDITEVKAPRHETLSYHAPDAATLVAALRPEETLTATIRWAHHHQTLRVTADAEGKISGVLGEKTVSKNVRPPESYAADRAACAHHIAGRSPPPDRFGRRLTLDEADCGASVLSAVRPACAHLDAAAERKCSEAHVDGPRPRCAPGHVLALGTARCVPLCDSDGQCRSSKTSTCTDYLGAKLCL